MSTTVADLLKRLGDIPPERVRLFPAPGTATIADVFRIEAKEDRLYELIDGVLVEKAMGFWESWVGTNLQTFLYNWVSPRKLGAITGGAGTMQIFPNELRMPDVAFTRWERLEDAPLSEPAPIVAPNLAILVLKAGNTKAEIARKRAEYFLAGTQLMWIVDPHACTVAVYTSPEEVALLRQEDTLDGGEVLPGFALELKQLFIEHPA